MNSFCKSQIAKTVRSSHVSRSERDLHNKPSCNLPSRSLCSFIGPVWIRPCPGRDVLCLAQQEQVQGEGGLWEHEIISRGFGMAPRLHYLKFKMCPTAFNGRDSATTMVLLIISHHLIFTKSNKP